MVRFASNQPTPQYIGDRLLLGSGLDTNWLQAARRTRQPAQPTQIVGNELGAYVLDKNRPYGGMGKFGFGISTAPAFMAGGTSPHAPGVQVPTQAAGPDPSGLISGLGADTIGGQAGFFENLLGGLGGIIAGSGGATVGRTLGSLPDFGMAAVSEAVNLPLGLLTSIPTLMSGFDDQTRLEYEQYINENPLNALFLIDDMARRQWEKDVDRGKISGLTRDMGPATNLWETLGWLGGAISVPMRALHRGLGEGSVYVDELLRATQQGRDVTNEFYASLQAKYREGIYGPMGSQEARDRMLDEVIVEMHGGPNRGVDVEEAGLFSFQSLSDLFYYTLTDPLIVADIVVGVGGRAAMLAAREVGQNVASSFGREAAGLAARESFISQVRTHVRDARQLATDEAADVIMAREPNAQIAAYREVAMRDEFAQWRDPVLEATTYMDRFYNNWYPAMRPVIDVVRGINNPLELFGRKGATFANNVFSHHTTEGWLRGGGGIENFVALKNEVGAVAPDVVAKLDHGAGIMAHFTARVWYRRELVNGIKRLGGVFREAPTVEAEAGLSGLKGSDLAIRLEMEATRHRKQFLALTPEAMRAQAAERLVLLGVKQTDAAALTAKMSVEKAALVDGLYFGYASSDLLNIVDSVKGGLTKKAGKSKLIDLDRLTPLGPEQMTTADAVGVLAAVKSKDIHAVRDFIDQFDLLRDNIGDRARKDAEVFKLVNRIVQDNLDKKGLPEVVPAATVGKMDVAIQRWASTNGRLGYRLGFKPPDEAIWRVTTDKKTGKIIAVNPWIDVTNKAATSARDMNRIQLARERLFHNIRGERIMSEARHEFNRITTAEAGLSKGEADALFARIMQQTEDLNVTPRGLSAKQVWETVFTHKFPEEVIDKVGSERKWAEMLVRSFEGKLSLVGATQKFTGKLKSKVAKKTSNYLGVVAEAIYPMVRFVWNPFFQAMELTEPFVLNTARGIKPGFRPKDVDKITAGVIMDIVDSSPRARDDMVEYGDWQLWGSRASKALSDPKSDLAKLSDRFFGRDITVGSVKRINYTKLFRDRFGETFSDAVARVQPSLIHDLIAGYGTADRGVIAVKYMTEQALVGKGSREFVLEALNAAKPHDFGAVETIVLQKLVALMPDEFETVSDMRAAIKAKTFTKADLEKHLTAVGADPNYIKRAWEVAEADGPERQWIDHLYTLARGRQIETGHAREILKARAANAGLSEEEYMARRVAGFASADMDDLGTLTPEMREVIQRQVRLADEPRTVAQMVPDENVRRSLMDIYRRHRYADREHGAVISLNTGEILWEGESNGPRITNPISGEVTGEGTGMSIPGWLARGNITVHIHPFDAPFSPADLASASFGNEAESWVLGPTRWYRAKPGAEGWLAKYPDQRVVDDLTDVDMFVRESAIIELNRVFEEKWMLGNQKFYGSYLEQPWYAAWRGTFDDPVLVQQELDAQVADSMWREMAAEYGWDYESGIVDRTRPDNLDDIINVQNDPGLMGEPHFFLQKYNELQSIATLMEKITGEQALTRTAYEAISAGEGASRAGWMPDLDTMDPPIADAVARDVHRWIRQRATELTGAPIVRATDAHGGWFNPGAQSLEESPNALDEIMGSDHDGLVSMLTRGLLGQQTSVVGWRGLGALLTNVDHAKGHRWAYSIVSPHSMTEAQAIRFQRIFTEELSGLSGWGYSLSKRAGGRYAITFIDHTDNSALNGAEDFVLQRVLADEQELENQIRIAALAVNNEFRWPLGSEYVGGPEAILFREVRNDWTVNPNGESYAQELTELGRSDIVANVANRLSREGDDVIADAFRRHAPAEFDAHVTGVRERGGTVPDWGVPPTDLAPSYPLAAADPIEFAYPGGKAALYDDATEPMSLQDLMRFRDQPAIDPNPWWVRDPETIVRYYTKLHDGRNGRFGRDPGVMFNYATYGAVSSGTDLTTSENIFTMLRINPSGSRLRNGLDEVSGRVQEVLRPLPRWGLDDHREVAMWWEAHQGLRASPYASDVWRWMKPERRTEIQIEVQKRSGELADGLATATGEAEIAAVYQRINKAMAKAGFKELHVHPVAPPNFVRVAMPEGQPPYQLQFSMMRESGQIRSTQSNAQIGRVLSWLNEGVYSNGDTFMSQEMRAFLQPQTWETMSQFAARMASIHAGLAAKTATWAVGSADPKLMNVVVMDRHNLRRVILDAVNRNDLESVLGTVSEGYAKKVRQWVTEERKPSTIGPDGEVVLGDLLQPEVPNAEGKMVNLLTGARAKWRADPPAALAAMQAKLDGIPGKVWSDFYRRNPEALELVALQNDGKILTLDGDSDYDLMSAAYMNMVRREMETMRAAGHGAAVDIMERWSAMQHGWAQWERQRGVIDPHVMGSPQWYSVPKMGPAEQHMGRRMTTPYPDQSVRFQRQNEEVQGATIHLKDGRLFVTATQAADVSTGLHEFAHLFEVDLDPSMRNVILGEYYAAHPDAPGGWDDNVSEWFAHQWERYWKAGKTRNRKMKGPMAAFSKWLKAAAQESADRQARKVAVGAKKTAVAEAMGLLKPHQTTLGKAERALGTAQRARGRARRALTNANQRLGVSELTARRDTHDAAIRKMKDRLIILRQSDGNADEIAEVADALRIEEGLRRAVAKRLRGAKRRTTIPTLEKRVADAEKDVAKAVKVWEKAKTKAKPFQDGVEAAKSMPTKVKGVVADDAPSDAMHGLFESLLKQPDEKAMPNSPVVLGEQYDLQEQAMYGAARMAARMAEDEAWRVHYFKRGRNVMERSINHPYFGLYPASYMWGKVLPELVRFLVKKPFGLEAPLGGLALSNVIYRQVMMEQAYDEDTRRWMAEHEKMWSLVSMFMPATPWEVPVNAPLWARRVAEHEAVRAGNVYEGETDPTAIDQMTPTQFTDVVTEMVQYAFGPAQSIQYVGEALGVVQNAGDVALSAANTTIDNVLNPQAAQPLAQPPLPGTPGAFRAPTEVAEGTPGY